MGEESVSLQGVVSADLSAFEATMRRIEGLTRNATTRATEQFQQLDRAQQRTAISAERYAQAQARTQQANTAAAREIERLVRAQRDAERATIQLQRAQLQLQQTQQGTTQTALGLGQAYRQIQGALAAFGLSRVIEESVQLSNRFRSLELAFQTVTGSAERGRETLAFLRQESDRLGTVFLSTARAFQGIAAAAQGTILEGQGAREIFLGITEAARATGRSQDELSRALVGAQQIIGKGVVSMEELRQQLGEALPQSIQTFARALGISTARLFELIEAGRVGLPEFLRFAQQLRTDVAGNIDAAGQTFEAGTNRFITALQDLGRATGDLITQSQGVNESLGLVSQGMTRLAAAIRAPDTALKEFFTTMLLGANATVLLRKNTEEQIGILGRLKEAYQDVQQFLGLRPPDLPAASISGTPLAGAPVPDIDELVVRRGSRAAEEEASAIARITALREQHGKAVIGSAQEQAQAIIQGLRQEEQQLRRNGVAYDEINRLRTQGPPSVFARRELEAQLRVLEQIVPTLSAADQALAALDVRQLQEQLRDLSEAGLPASVRQARELEREIARVRLSLQGLSPEERAIGSAQLRALEEQLQRLGTAALPPTVQQVRDLETEITRLAASIITLPPGDQILAQADLQGLQDQLRQLNSTGLPESVIQTQNLRIEMERLQDTINNRALELGPIGIEQAQASLAELQAQYDDLTQSLEQRLTFEGLSDFGEAMGDLEADTNEGIAAAERFVTQQFELRNTFAQTREESEGLFNTYIQDLQRAGVAQQQIEDLVLERYKDSAREQERIRRQQAEDIRETTRDLLDLVSTIFDAFDLGSEKTEARIKILLQTFTGALARMAETARQTNISPTVSGATGQGQFGLDAGSAEQAVGLAQTAGQFGFQTRGQATQTQGGAFGSLQQGNYAGAIGQAAGGLAAGYTTGQALYPFTSYVQQFSGESLIVGEVFGSRAGQRAANTQGGIIAGAAGGAIAGNEIAGGIGLVVGALVGAVAGGILGGLQGIPHSRELDVLRVDLPKATNDALGLYLDGALNVLVEGSGRVDPEQTRILDEGLTAIAQNIVDQLQGALDIAPEDVQQAAGGAIEDLLGALGGNINSILISVTGGISDEVEELLQQLGPALQAEFQEYIAIIQRIGETTQAIDNAVDALEQRRDQLLGGIQGQRQRLQETFLSPARVFSRRQQELEGLVETFRESPQAERVALVPQIQDLIDEVFNLANQEGVLGGDMASLLELQANLIDINKELEQATQRAFDRQITQAERSRDILVRQLESLTRLDRTTDAHFRRANRSLDRIADFLATESPAPLVGSFQTSPGETRQIPRTGFAIVHEGEIIGRAAGTGQRRVPGSQESLATTNELLKKIVDEGGGRRGVPVPGGRGPFGERDPNVPVARYPIGLLTGSPERQQTIGAVQQNAFVRAIDTLRGTMTRESHTTHTLLRQLTQRLLTHTPLPFVGSFQTFAGQTRHVGQTGMAVVHEGETVSRGRAGDTYTFNVTVNAGQGTNAQALSREFVDTIERQMRRREAFRQRPVSQRG